MKRDFYLPWETTFFSLLFLISYVQAQSSSFMESNCSGLSYAANSAFETNLNNLFSSLSSSTSNSTSDNSTAGEFPDLAYGLFLCLADLPSDACQSCVQAAISGISQECSSHRRGVIWYDDCLLRYSDENFFGVVDANGSNYTNPAHPKVSSTAPLDMISKIVKQAPNQPLMFETFSLGPETAFGMVQCTSDLSSEGCGKCLDAALAPLPGPPPALPPLFLLPPPAPTPLPITLPISGRHTLIVYPSYYPNKICSILCQSASDV